MSTDRVLVPRPIRERNARVALLLVGALGALFALSVVGILLLN